MKVDVIIPTHNRKKWLIQAVKSVLDQSFEEFELFIIDDGSTDETAEAVKDFQRDKRVHFHRISHSGVSKARNYGVSLGSSPWLAFLDSDDQWLPDKLERQVDLIKDQPHYPLVHGEEIWIRRGRRVNPKKYHQKSGGDIFKRSLGMCLISPSAAMIKRDLFCELGGFDERFIVCEDYDLWLKITSRHEVGFIEKPILIKNGGHQDQLSRKYVAMDSWRVQSMKNLYEQGSLESSQKEHLLQELLLKSQILITGFKKHSHDKKAQEMSILKDWAERELESLFCQP